MPPTPHLMASALDEAAQAHVEDLTAAHDTQTQKQERPQTGSQQQAGESNQHNQANYRPLASVPQSDGYISKVGILTSSLPYYHDLVMKARREEQKRKKDARLRMQEEQGEPMEPHEAEYFQKLSLEPSQPKDEPDHKNPPLRNLNPHSKSTMRLNNILAKASEHPEAAVQANSKKNRHTKWQFGIRSRNQPLDAMLCIYKALKAHGAQWHVTPPKSDPNEGPGPYPVYVAGATHIADSQLSESPEKDKKSQYISRRDAAPNTSSESDQQETHSQPEYDASESSDDEDVDPTVTPPSYIPKDPWCIHVRWLKEGMYPPGTVHTQSANNSRVDLNDDEINRRRSSIIGSLSSATGSATSVIAGTQISVNAGSTTSVATGLINPADHACFVYMDVQLYQLEVDTYLVDFKCAGYEAVKEVVDAVNTAEKKLVGSGFRVMDKDVTSPQPFLDLTNKLVIHLAKG